MRFANIQGFQLLCAKYFVKLKADEAVYLKSTNTQALATKHEFSPVGLNRVVFFNFYCARASSITANVFYSLLDKNEKNLFDF